MAAFIFLFFSPFFLYMIIIVVSFQVEKGLR